MDRKDEQLVPVAQLGDKKSFDELIRRYKQMVKFKARAFSPPPGLESDDVLQEGMIGLFKAIRDYRAGYGATFRVFAGMCVERQITSALRSATRKKHAPLNRSLPLDTADLFEDNPMMRDHKAVNPLRSLIEKEEFRQARKSLTERESAVLGLKLNGKTYEEIAEELGINAKAVDNALRRAKAKLGG